MPLQVREGHRFCEENTTTQKAIYKEQEHE
jgi:hypothetical protein